MGRHLKLNGRHTGLEQGQLAQASCTDILCLLRHGDCLLLVSCEHLLLRRHLLRIVLLLLLLGEVVVIVSPVLHTTMSVMMLHSPSHSSPAAPSVLSAPTSTTAAPTATPTDSTTTAPARTAMEESGHDRTTTRAAAR